MTQEHSVAKQLFAGRGEMALRMRSHDWAKTSLGAVETWPQSLRSALSICLNSRFPIAIYWGSDCLLLYNDAWRPIVGDKHSWALGHPAREVWSEIWDSIGSELAGVLATGEGTFHKDELLSMHRFGYTEECFFEYTFNPIQGEAGVIEGVFNVVTETTYRVLNERRARLLREAAARTAIAKTAEEACTLMIEALKSDPFDLPFALLYLVDQDENLAYLSGSTESAQDGGISPAVIDLAAADADPWLIAQVTRTGDSQVVGHLSRVGALPGSPWPEPPQEAMVLPISVMGQGKVTGVLVAVASPRLRLDDSYHSFFHQIAGQLAVAIANAQAYEAERKRAEALTELDRAKTLFFSNVSHEFRTPLTLMLSPLEDLATTLDQQLQPDQREQFQLIQRNGLRLQKLVNTLLDFSRIEAGRVQASYEPTDLAAYTAELASVFRSLIERAGMELMIDCPRLPEPVYVDREMWEKIVLNLISNAFKFTFTGQITVRLHPIGNTVVLSVSDTGVGIPEAELPRLFERFHRVEGNRSRTYEGSGIGLALVQELVKLHHGTINVTSQVDRGTTFTITLPLGMAHLPGDRIAAPRTLASTALGANPFVTEAARWITEEGNEVRGIDYGEELSPHTPHPTPARILLVDDNADMRDYVKRILSQCWQVETVGDGLAALGVIVQNPPDLVISDVMMPRLDGFGLLRELRARPATQNIPVILLSARAGEEARIEGLEAGADDYLTKPFSARELLARVEATLKLAQTRKQAAETLQQAYAELELQARQLEETNQNLQQAIEELQVQEEEMQTQNDELILARQTAQAEEQRYQNLFNFAPSGYLVTDANGVFQEVNQAVSILLAYDPTTSMPKVLSLYVDESSLGNFRNLLLELYRSPDPQICELTLKSCRNRPFPAAITAVAIRNDRNQTVGIRWSIQDISALKQAEANLQKSNERLSAAQIAAKIGAWDWDVAAGSIFWSREYYTLYGLDPSVPSTYENWLACLLEADRTRCDQMIQAILQQRQPSLNFEFRINHPTQGVRWFGSLGQVYYKADGSPQRAIGISIDISDRKQAEEALRQSEERYRYLVETIPQLVWTANAEGMLIDINQRWADYTGLTLAQAQTQGWEAIVHPEDIPTLSQHWAAAQQNNTHYRAEGRMRRADGAYRWHLHEAIPLRDGSGRVIKWFGTATDIEAQKRLARQRQTLLEQEQTAREQAETANRIKDEFLAVLSHELRSPLNPILGWSKLLRSGKLNTSKTAQALETIERNAQLQVQLIDDLLDISRILRGKLTLNIAPINLSEVIAAALETVQLAAEAKFLSIQTQILPPPSWVNGDAGRLQQVVWNLLSNAVKFTPEGGQIQVRLEQVATNTGTSHHAQIEVIDTGKGINPDFLPYVFEHFRQEDGATTRKFGGLGLGLAIARQIVELHGGTITVDSPGEGQGATFTVRLPLLKQQAIGQGSRLAEEIVLTTQPQAPLAGLQILVVDDDSDSREFVVFLLEQAGAVVTHVASTLAALQVLENYTPDLIVSDIGMPDMDGYTLLREIRTRSHLSRVPAIALTAYAGELDQQQALEAGFQRHLAKPVEPENLLKTVITLMGHYRSQKQS